MHPLRQAPPIEPGQHVLIRPYIPQINQDGLFHLSCTDRYPDNRSAYAAFDQDAADVNRVELAKRHFIHAAMANNVYLDPDKKPVFRLPGWTLHESWISETGLALQVYGDGATLAGSSRIVVAYRGTDFDSGIDWLNNFALRDPPQYRQAYKHLKELRAHYPNARITVTGHSLGGGIAMNMSLRVSGVEAVGFNMSPRVRFGRTRAFDSYRASIFEVGEILTGATKFYAAVMLPDNTHYGNYNFLDYRLFAFSPVPEHGIYELTRALTVVAMTRESQQAREFFRVNIGEEQARKVDWEHCQAIFR
ncbi:hypothetical protein ASD86_14355 [Lysobacter sp. Root690]|nr:hypothetical protein ASD86_14355 [Lysobacter sp. Root690]